MDPPPNLRVVLLVDREKRYVTESGVEYLENPLLRAIHAPFHTNEPKSGPVSPTAARIRDAFNEFVKNYEPTQEEPPVRTNAAASSFVRAFYSTCPREYPNFKGANTTDHAVVAKVQDREYVFPPHSSFTNTRDLLSFKFDQQQQPAGPFDLIVIDPPWVNKFVKRRKRSSAGYSVSPTSSLQTLDVPSLLSSSPHSTLVLIWCTNSPRLQEELQSVLLPSWNLTLLSTWYWLKVTSSKTTPTVPFTREGAKQPFETIFVATNNPQLHSNKEQLVLISTPSAVHSHKPDLTDVVQQQFKVGVPQMRCCELFARNLLPFWTSFGNESVKLNDKQLFLCSSSADDE